MNRSSLFALIVASYVCGCGAEAVTGKAWVGAGSPSPGDGAHAGRAAPAERGSGAVPGDPTEDPDHAASVLATSADPARRTQAMLAKLMTGHQIHSPPRLPRPALHAPFKDPVFGTCITRVTDPSQWPNATRIRHYYSKANPWNADGTLAILISDDGTNLLYDAQAWKPIRALNIASSDAEIQWHPTDPNLLYYLDFVDQSPNVRAMFRYDVRDDARHLVHDFSEYETARGRLEGNFDRAGRYYAMFGFKGEDTIEAFVYDLEKDALSRRVAVTQKMADDWISVTPSGKYVVMMGGDRSRVYDIQMNHLRDLSPGSFGHGDLCSTTDGRDVFVYDGADNELDGNHNINIADLATGKERVGLRLGWRTTPHVSCRNLDLPGWALISTQGPDPAYPNHDFEILWLKLDGSGEVRRVAHHHSNRENGGYFAEQQAVTNRQGTKVLFASNWGGKTISDYLVDLRSTSGGGSNAGAGPACDGDGRRTSGPGTPAITSTTH
jgi:hypothetical protein